MTRAEYKTMNELTLTSQQDNLIIGSFVFTPTGLIVSNPPTYEEWTNAGKFLQHVERSVQFWIGDWLNYGERNWGETYAQAVNETGLEEKTLRNYKYVSSKVEMSRRRDNLTYSHHAEVAGLGADEQDKWLDVAEAEHLTRAELRSRINKNHGNPPDYSIVCPHCGGIIEVDRKTEVIHAIL